jgi:hypothetical protein
MSEIPDQIVLERHLHLHSPGFNRGVRRVILALIGILLVLGLANVFGQHPATHRADSPTASLELSVPDHLRGGLLYQARFTIVAHSDVRNAVLQFSPGWNEGMQINTIEPGPISEASRDGDMLFTLGHIPAGQKHRLFMQFQVDPTNVGRRRADVTLYDGSEKLLTIERTVTVYP